MQIIVLRVIIHRNILYINIFSHLPLVGCSHADSFGFICPGFEVSVSRNSLGLHSNNSSLLRLNANISMLTCSK